MKLKMKTMLKLMSFWPPYLGAGVRINNISDDMTSLNVEMKLKFWNKNIKGTQFGGSLYSMIDPFLVLLLMHHLGREHIIWDKSATIHFKKPAEGKVFAKILITKEQIDEIHKKAINGDKVEPKFTLHINDENNNIIAEIEKTLYIRKKASKK
ncbi:YiiD C-terminal domain-containing protein [Fluviispira multicolorata]|uniref:DUF4442 domain-containing protein n=1 Tax=Fluviispira multicolorata TaxID=2654512 RepID=A0A833JB27_9BACT|nr:YiiD C-terminal domain-containing protein [Fluviispira multicolorata]KAB8028555.1 DUF4442 domain-containing protein [Fluviispira multicolorata]